MSEWSFSCPVFCYHNRGRPHSSRSGCSANHRGHQARQLTLEECRSRFNGNGIPAGRQIQALQVVGRNLIRAGQQCCFGQAQQIAPQVQPREAGKGAQIRYRAGQLVVAEAQIRQTREGAHIRYRPGQPVGAEEKPG